jgi:hypothetical protein
VDKACGATGEGIPALWLNRRYRGRDKFHPLIFGYLFHLIPSLRRIDLVTEEDAGMKTLATAFMALVLFAALLLAGCGKGEQQAPQTEQELAAEEQPADTVSKEVAVGEQETTPETKATKPAAKKEKPVVPTTTKVTIPAGTAFTVSLETLLRTDSNQVGDEFVARTVAPVDVEGMLVIPTGAEIRGHLSQVEEPHRTKGKAKMTLSFDSFVDARGTSQTLAAQPVELEAEGDKVSDEEKVAAGGVIGGIIGAATSKKKGKGAAIGAAIGAAAGGAVALATKGGQLELAPGQQISVQIAEPTQVSVPIKP